jgi:hypothetical protein
MPAFQKNPKISMNFTFEKNFKEGRCVREVPRGFAPCTFLVPPILVKLVFLDSAKTKLLESDPLS